MIKKLLSIALLCASIFTACSDSDSYIFDEETSQSITVGAFVTTAFDENAERVKTDTISPKDSLIFLSTILPSKSVRNQKIYWTLDGKLFANEYSFKASINVSGEHKVAFVFVDFFGDTLSDTITLYSSSVPVLDTVNFIPANETQTLPYNKDLNFAWNATDPDSMWNLNYHFILQKTVTGEESEKKIVLDTILDHSYFTFKNGLSPLTMYSWSVTASNSLGISSTSSISGNFYTSSESDESGVLATIIPSNNEYPKYIRATLLNDSDSVFRELNEILVSPETGSFYVKPIPAGNYRMVLSCPSQKDFFSDTLHISLHKNQLSQIDSIPFIDSIPPVVQSVAGTDSLEYQDTIKFIVRDGGDASVPPRISAKIDGSQIRGVQFENDTLYVPISPGRFWSYRILTIIAIDHSGNKEVKNFYMIPNANKNEENLL